MYRMTLSLFESCVFLLGVKVGEEGERARMANSFHTGFNRDSFLFFLFIFQLGTLSWMMHMQQIEEGGQQDTSWKVERAKRGKRSANDISHREPGERSTKKHALYYRNCHQMVENIQAVCHRGQGKGGERNRGPKEICPPGVSVWE